MKTTNESEVIRIQRESVDHKRDYMSTLEPLVKKVSNGVDLMIGELNDCCQKANAFFNHVESFVGQSDLLGAKKNGEWVVNFAETCYSVLEAYRAHRLFLNSHKETFGNSWVAPSRFSMAGMQRMVKKYLPKEDVSLLRTEFKAANLSIHGFDLPAPENDTIVPRWQVIVGLVIGITLVGISILLALNIPDPTRWQEFVFRGVLALGLACIAPIIPGFIKLSTKFENSQTGYFTLVAGGAIAIFVLIWIVTPASVYGTVD